MDQIAARILEKKGFQAALLGCCPVLVVVMNSLLENGVEVLNAITLKVVLKLTICRTNVHRSRLSCCHTVLDVMPISGSYTQSTTLAQLRPSTNHHLRVNSHHLSLYIFGFHPSSASFFACTLSPLSLISASIRSLALKILLCK